MKGPTSSLRNTLRTSNEKLLKQDDEVRKAQRHLEEQLYDGKFQDNLVTMAVYK